MHRRDLLRAAGAGALTGVAGCATGTPGGGATTAPEGGTATADDGAGGAAADAVPDHPATADISDQPRKGDLGGNLVVAFEDPSCHRCRAFEEETVPDIEANLVDPGKAALVFRGYPVVYPWGEPATQALEATFARSEPAFWALLEHYFGTQSEFSTENVLDRTRAFLDAETDVDGSTVVADVEDEAYAEAVQADLEAGRDADAGSVTPTVFLFRDGEYVTRASGSVSYEVVATALGES